MNQKDQNIKQRGIKVRSMGLMKKADTLNFLHPEVNVAVVIERDGVKFAYRSSPGLISEEGIPLRNLFGPEHYRKVAEQLYAPSPSISRARPSPASFSGSSRASSSTPDLSSSSSITSSTGPSTPEQGSIYSPFEVPYSPSPLPFTFSLEPYTSTFPLLPSLREFELPTESASVEPGIPETPDPASLSPNPISQPGPLRKKRRSQTHRVSSNSGVSNSGVRKRARGLAPSPNWFE